MSEAPRGGNILSAFWTPLVAIGCSGPRGPNAQISVSTFGASVVPDQPRLLVILYKRNYTHDLVAAKGDFTVSLLAESQVDLLPKLGFVSGRDRSKLDGIEYTMTERGNPVFTGCVGWLECRVIQSSDFGDATGFLAAVVENHRLSAEAPMYWSEVSPKLPEAWRAQWDAKMARDIEDYRGRMRW